MGVKELVRKIRRAEAGATPLGKRLLAINAEALGYEINDNGEVVDIETGAVLTADSEEYINIMAKTRQQMESDSSTGKELIEAMTKGK